MEVVDVRQRREKKNKKKKDDTGIVHGGATEMNVEDCGEKSGKKYGKKKRKGEEREKGIYHGYEDGKNDFETVVIKEEMSRKKAKQNKRVENDVGRCKINVDKTDPNGKSHVEKKKVRRSLDIIGDEMEFGDNVKLAMVKDKDKKWNKEKKNKNNEAICAYSVETINDRKVGKDEGTKQLENYEREEISKVKNGNERDIVKKKNERKKKRDNMVSNVEYVKLKNIDKEKGHVQEYCGIEAEHVKKKKGNKYKDESKHVYKEMVEKLIDGKSLAIDDDKVSHNRRSSSRINQKRDEERESFVVEMEKSDHIKWKKAKSTKDIGKKMVDKGETNAKVSEQNADHFTNSDHMKTDKRVKFSSTVEVFAVSDDTIARDDNQEKNLNFGKRYSQKEDKIIKDAVLNYIEDHGLGEDGLNMILHVQSYPQVRNCWNEICTSLPWRSKGSVYKRAHALFERDESRTWTPEEKEFIRKFYEEHGPQWKQVAYELGKFSVHVKDTWRRIKLPNLKKGPWTQEEYQTLFDLVNMDLHLKTFEETKSKNTMLRNNISWEVISRKMGTRTDMDCCNKWYSQLKSPLMKAGKWAPEDDYGLVNALLSLDACCVEDVNWDDLIQDRPGDVCRRRFKQMINHLGEHGIKPFAEQVQVLASRYCPDLPETGEAADANTPVE